MVFVLNKRKFFTNELQINIDDQLARVENKYASCIALDGGVGKSKTCSAVQIADYINYKRGLPPIDFNKQLARGGKELFEKVPKVLAEKLPVLIYDEAGDFSKKRTLTTFNFALARFFEQYRQFKVILIVSCPLFDVLDRSLLDLQVVRFLIHVNRRNNVRNSCQIFSLHRLYYIKGRMAKLDNKGFAYQIINCNMHCNIYRLPPLREKELEKFSLQGKENDMLKVNMMANKLVSRRDLEDRLNRGGQWVRKNIKLLKLKPKQIIKKVHYYDDSVVDKLADKKARA